MKLHKKRSFARIKATIFKIKLLPRKKRRRRIKIKNKIKNKNDSFLKYFDYYYIGNIDAMLEENVELQINGS